MFSSVVLGPDQSPLQLAEAFAELARALAAKSSVEETLSGITAYAVTVMPGAEDASITMLSHGKFRSLAATSDVPRNVDRIQYESEQGPCVDTILDPEDVFLSDDIAVDTRWPVFGARAAAETGVHSMLAYRLFLEDDDTIGSLNLYATVPAAFGRDAVPIGNLLATHSAIALSRAHDNDRANNLHTALQTNRTIGTAIGILMARHLITEDDAFNLLRIVSQRSHRKLADIARDVIDTGTLEQAKDKATPG
jgi:transcriptional regulator with GAF, ATPase, and Fis domain